MLSLKNKRVTQARFHTGAYIGSSVLNSVVPGKNNVVLIDLVEHNVGLYVKSYDRVNDKTYHDIVPFSDVLSFQIEDFAEEKPVAPTSGKK